MSVEQRKAGIERGWDGSRFDPCPRDTTAFGKVFASGQLGGRALAGKNFDDLSFGIIDDDRNFAAKAEASRIGDAEGQNRGGRGIGRVPASFQDFDPGSDRFGTAGADGSLIARTLGARQRFLCMEQWLADQGKTVESCTLAEMEVLWSRAKKREHDAD